MKNPFVYGETVSGENFCNRTREIKELVADIINCQNVIIFSPRRYGKTSLIKKVLDKIKRKGILTFYVDLYPAINKTKFIEIYAGAISNGLPGGVRQVAKKIREYLPRIIPKVVMDGQSVHFEFEFDRISNISSNIDDILVAAKKVADQKKKTAVVVFDEFQEIANLDDDEIERKMRSVFQNHRNVSYIFMGSKTHLMRDIFNNPNRPFYKSGKHFPLDKIDPKELNLFAKRKFLDQAIVIGHNELNSILNNTECHPYYFQMLCHVLWERSRY
ncbi:MAG: ATP-binding protein [Deltaproteobacteria bacterium]|nr:ATP-binding protein [Deltaproteobacteria bacterium]